MQKIAVIDRDEAHFAQATRQMLETGNYFQIRFQNVTRFQKPPGINWLQSLSVKLFSNSASTEIWPYRIPSAFGAIFSVWLLYYFCLQYTNNITAIIAAALLASSLLVVIESHMAVIDSSLLSSVVLMQGSLLLIYTSKLNKPILWPLCFWVSMAYGFLLKGVTPWIACLTIGFLCILDKNLSLLKQVRWIAGSILLLLITLSWLLLVNAAEHSNYLMQMFRHDLLPKLQGGHESHGHWPLFHLALLPLMFWPASLFILQAVEFAVIHRRQKLTKFLIAWIIPTWIFFECMPTKLPQYVLPTFPAIAWLAAMGIYSGRNLPTMKWNFILQYGWLIFSLGLICVTYYLIYWLLDGLRIWEWCMAGVAIGCSIAATVTLRKQFYNQSLGYILLLALSIYPIFFGSVLPNLGSILIGSKIESLIKTNQLVHLKKLTQSSPLLIVGYNEPSVVFNIGTNLVDFTNIDRAISLLKVREANRWLLIETRQFDSWIGSRIFLKKYHLDILGTISGLNYSTGHWVGMLLIGDK